MSSGTTNEAGIPHYGVNCLCRADEPREISTLDSDSIKHPGEKMLHFKLHFLRLLSIPFILSLILSIGCASKRLILPDQPPMAFRYNFVEGRDLHYLVSNDADQKMKIQGKSVEIEMDDVLQFSLHSREISGENTKYEVIIDSAYISITSPQGKHAPDMSMITGSPFELIVTSGGTELDIIGADSMQYEIEPGRKNTIKSKFQTFFPNLPDRPVEAGNSWTSRDTIREINSGGELVIHFETENTLRGFEIVSGYECAVVATSAKGKLQGGSVVGDATINSTGEISATGTWYFAYKEGILVKEVSEGVADIDITVSGKQELKIPTRREFEMETLLVK